MTHTCLTDKYYNHSLQELQECNSGLKLTVTYGRVGVHVAVDVEDGQNVDVHLVQQAGHLCIAAVGGHSLRKITQKICYRLWRLLSEHLHYTSVRLCYLVDKPLAESRRDPLSGMNTTIQEDRRLRSAGLLTNL